MVVEDEPEIRELLSFSITRAGYDVQPAESAEQALQMLDSGLPELVIIDWMLPGIEPTGRKVELLVAIRSGNTAADSDMQRAIELIAEGFENFPEGSGAWDCVVVQASNPQLAKKMAAYVGNHPSYIVQQQLDEVLNPYPSLWKLIRKYMLAKMLDEPNADELLGELGERLPLQEWLEGDSD